MEAAKLLETLMFTVNEKAKEASKRKMASTTEKDQCFQHGQFMAFNEVYTLLSNEHDSIQHNTAE